MRFVGCFFLMFGWRISWCVLFKRICKQVLLAPASLHKYLNEPNTCNIGIITRIYRKLANTNINIQYQCLFHIKYLSSQSIVTSTNEMVKKISLFSSRFQPTPELVITNSREKFQWSLQFDSTRLPCRNPTYWLFLCKILWDILP